MLFNSLEFAVFLLIVFIIYWRIGENHVKAQNILLLIAGYVFYGSWDWRFLLLLFSLSSSNYIIGLKIGGNEIVRNRKVWYFFGLVINLGVLLTFKYFNFFIDSFIDLFSVIGYEIPRSTTKIILPVGISFYVFLSLSYIIDIYKKNISAHRNFIEVLLTLSFFPIILAGPIQRPSSLLPQISRKREFSYDIAVDGLRQILWGLFAKVVIADNISVYADDFFMNSSAYSGSALFIGIVFYTIQIYADFSGYSNVAIGVSKLLGFNLMQNFNNPYFSRDITEFWKRWHISLTTWFRDYLFLPISFNLSWNINGEKVLLMKKDFFIYIVASIITWLLTGLWHGANYTFIFWGIIHGFFLIIYRAQLKPRKKIMKKYNINNNSTPVIVLESLFTMFIVMISWVFFRSSNVHDAVVFLKGLFSKSLFSIPDFPNRMMAMISFVLIVIFYIFEWIGRQQQYAIQNIGIKWHIFYRYMLYYAITIAILWYSGGKSEFIYFKF